MKNVKVQTNKESKSIAQVIQRVKNHHSKISEQEYKRETFRGKGIEKDIIKTYLSHSIDEKTEKQILRRFDEDNKWLRERAKLISEKIEKKNGGLKKEVNKLVKLKMDSLKKIIEQPFTVDSPYYELINTPFEISSTNGLKILSSQIIPSNSWAKFRYTSSKTNSVEMSFYYLWQNLKNKYAVINANGYLIFKGECFAGSDGGFWPGNRFGSIAVNARLIIDEYWNQPPTSPYFQFDQYQVVKYLSSSTGGFWEVGAIEYEKIFRGYDLSYKLMIVPPTGVVVFRMTANMTSSIGSDGGYAEADFSKGDYQVASPAVLVTILS